MKILLLIGLLFFTFHSIKAARIINQKDSVRTPSDSKMTMPEYKGGTKTMMIYLNKNIRYPVSAANDNIQGRVGITFLVKQNGTLTNFKVKKSIRKDLDDEAIRVIQSMPKWIPGTKDGKPIDITFYLPIIFSLKK